jgi:hypothetical protein
LIPDRGNIFLLAAASRPDLELTQPPIQWIPGDLFLELSARDVKLTVHLHLVQRFGMNGAIPPLSTSFHGMVLNKHQTKVYLLASIIRWLKKVA